jgi:exodeoxyribonuclease V
MEIDQKERLFLNYFNSHLGLEPSVEQANCMRDLSDFTLQPQERSIYMLTGFAGTGKTTLLGAYVKTLQSLKIKSVLLAPTGRAAKVFSNKAAKRAFTIHKRIYRKQNTDTGSIQLALAPNLSQNTIFIVDEASMIADFSVNDTGNVSARNLLEDLIEYVFYGKNCSLIFVGDEGQLPPVGSDFSPALNLDYLNHSFRGLNIQVGKLVQVLRQTNDSDILKNATMLRGVQEFMYPKLSLQGKNDIVLIDGTELQDEIESSYQKFGMDETIVITRSNKRANLYNQHIRNRILWFEEELCSGDYLMVVKNNYFWLDEKSQAGFIANGEICIVKKIHQTIEQYGFRFARVALEMLDYPEIDQFECYILLDTLTIEAAALDRDSMKKLFFEIEKEYLVEHNKKKRYEKIMKDPFFNALQVKFAYAITCHKAQGGQWESVFLDHGFLTEETLDKSFFRWLYTGFTRASEKLHLIQFYPEFFE